MEYWTGARLETKTSLLPQYFNTIPSAQPTVIIIVSRLTADSEVQSSMHLHVPRLGIYFYYA